MALLLARFALFQQQAPLDSNFTLHLHTTEVRGRYLDRIGGIVYALYVSGIFR